MTGQGNFDRDSDAGVDVSIHLANLHLVSRDDPRATFTRLAEILSIDPPSVAELAERHVDAFIRLGDQLHRIVAVIVEGDLDRGALRVNALLESSPAHPHLAKDAEGTWRLHHHPVDTELVAMWTAICAEAMARLIGAGHADRLGICAAVDCGSAFLDQSKNGSRRFCTLSCQNRTKATAFRARRAMRAATSTAIT